MNIPNAGIIAKLKKGSIFRKKTLKTIEKKDTEHNLLLSTRFSTNFVLNTYSLVHFKKKQSIYELYSIY